MLIYGLCLFEIEIDLLAFYQDVKGPQIVAFNLPNDERIVKDRGTSMVMLKNVSEAKYCIFFGHGLSLIILSSFGVFFMGDNWTYNILVSHFSRFKHILQPIANACITNEQREFVDFDSYFTHVICHECCHGIGPHTITLPDGKETTVRLVSTINILS